MTIPEARERCKTLLDRVPRDILCLIVLLFASSLSFGLGFLAGNDRGAERRVVVETTPFGEFEEKDDALPGGQVVASKSGTKYYFSHCSGASRISDANKIWFTSAVAAERAGYTLAANCRAP